MKLCQKIGLGLTALALAAGTYLSCLEQKALKQDIQKISQSQTLDSKLPNSQSRSYFTKQQKDSLGYLTRLTQYKGEEKQEKEPMLIAPKDSDLDDIKKAAAENCNGSCLVYQDGDGNFRLADNAGTIYFDDECFGNFTGPGWLFYTPWGDILYSPNKSAPKNTEAHNLIEWNKCD